MTTNKEKQEIVDHFIKKNRNKDLVLYHCTSGYPISFKDTCLLEVKKLSEEYGDTVKDIGFSGHHLGIDLGTATDRVGAELLIVWQGYCLGDPDVTQYVAWNLAAN